MAGRITVSPATINWTDPSALLSNIFVLSAGTGIYATVPTGSQEQVDSLNIASAPVGSVFAAQEFIKFLTNAALSPLNINYIFPGGYSSAACDPNGTPAVGQTCTPPNAGNGSPFEFRNTPGGSTASFTFAGVTNGGQAAWTATFTSQFLVPYQQVFKNLAANGSVTNTYSATVEVNSVPEPGTMLLFGLGLCGIGLLKFRKA